jgi:hypothetical protein
MKDGIGVPMRPVTRRVATLRRLPPRNARPGDCRGTGGPNRPELGGRWAVPAPRVAVALVALDGFEHLLASGDGLLGGGHLLRSSTAFGASLNAPAEKFHVGHEVPAILFESAFQAGMEVPGMPSR